MKCFIAKWVRTWLDVFFPYTEFLMVENHILVADANEQAIGTSPSAEMGSISSFTTPLQNIPCYSAARKISWCHHFYPNLHSDFPSHHWADALIRIINILNTLASLHPSHRYINLSLRAMKQYNNMPKGHQFDIWCFCWMWVFASDQASAFIRSRLFLEATWNIAWLPAKSGKKEGWKWVKWNFSCRLVNVYGVLVWGDAGVLIGRGMTGISDVIHHRKCSTDHVSNVEAMCLMA